MEQKVPRLVLAGTNSGCGKTTVTCAVLQALVSRGLRVGAAKCGPDYIDPMFHSRIIGAKSSNLDAFFFDPDTLRYLLARNARGCDVTVIEGVMGYYDGLGLTSTRASTYEVARETQSPVVLVVNARGAALSVLAAVEGFLHFAPDSGIRGVILNGCSAMSYGPLARELENRLGGLHERGVVMKNGIGMSLADLYEERVPLYEKYADLTIDINGLSVRDAARKLVDQISML